MRFQAFLPNRNHYISLRTKGDRFIFEDCRTSLLRLDSPVVNPFDKKWDIVIRGQFSKSDKSKYLSRVNLKLFPLESTTTPTHLIREEVKAKLLSIDTSNILYLLDLPGESLIKVLYRFEKL